MPYADVLFRHRRMSGVTWSVLPAEPVVPCEVGGDDTGQLPVDPNSVAVVLLGSLHRGRLAWAFGGQGHLPTGFIWCV